MSSTTPSSFITLSTSPCHIKIDSGRSSYWTTKDKYLQAVLHFWGWSTDKFLNAETCFAGSEKMPHWVTINSSFSPVSRTWSLQWKTNSSKTDSTGSSRASSGKLIVPSLFSKGFFGSMLKVFFRWTPTGPSKKRGSVNETRGKLRAFPQPRQLTNLPPCFIFLSKRRMMSLSGRCMVITPAYWSCDACIVLL